jgi:hypothetical protein
MSDAYLAISEIADDAHMQRRLNSAAVQQDHLGEARLPPDPLAWVMNNRYLWASSPGWGAAWDSALAGHPDEPDYEPGKDPAVITDGMILATIQTLGA